MCIRDIITEVKTATTGWKKIFESHVTDKEKKNLLQLNNSNKITQFGLGQSPENTFPQKTYNCPKDAYNEGVKVVTFTKSRMVVQVLG